MNSSRRIYGRTMVFLLIAVVATGCARVRPIYQVEIHPIPQRATALTLKQIEAGIIKAGKLKNWRIAKIESGRLEGLISWRKNSAIVTIEYNQRFFSIRYKSSQNLSAKKASGDEPYAGEQVIHRFYNRRVRALETAIDHELAFSGL